LTGQNHTPLPITWTRDDNCIGEITFTVRDQEPRVLKAGESVDIPRGTVHRNENKSTQPTRTMELLIMDKGKPQNSPAE
jgi:quercetin dioxygenase-like cupin family protein